MKQNILIVGGSGQFGNILAKKLNRTKNIIITTRNILRAQKKVDLFRNFTLIKLDILNKKQISNILTKYKPSIIFYFAGQSSPKISFIKKNETLRSNYIGCKNFLEVIRKKKINTKFLNASSSEIFKPSNNRLNLSSKKEPISPYGISKLKSFKITQLYRKEFNLKMAGMGGSDLPDLKQEFNSLPHDRGTLSMARSSDPDSANSQFFICFKPAPFLDRQYTVFGKVIEGMEFVDKIKRGDENNNGSVSDPDKIISFKSQ